MSKAFKLTKSILYNYSVWISMTIICLILMVHSNKVEARPYVHSCEYKERQTDLSALACNIYFESRGEVTAGKLGSGFVSLNRLKHGRFKGTLVDIIYKPFAFSWTNDGKSDRVYDLNSWINSLDLAAWLLQLDGREYKLLDVTDGALFYHRYDMKEFPKWAGKENITGRVGEHIYYLIDRKA